MDQARVDRPLPPGPLVGFTGPRNLPPKLFIPIVQAMVKVVAQNNRGIVVGCARGLDSMVRGFSGSWGAKIRVYNARADCHECGGRKRLEEQGLCPACGGTGCHYGSMPGALAKRSMEMVQEVGSRGKGSAMIGFPDMSCPRNIVPERRWLSGKPKSGTWSTLALAAGLKIPVFIVPCCTEPQHAGHMIPQHWPGSFVPAGPRYPWSAAYRYLPEEIHAHPQGNAVSYPHQDSSAPGENAEETGGDGGS